MDKTVVTCSCGKKYWMYAYLCKDQSRCPPCQRKVEAEADKVK